MPVVKAGMLLRRIALGLSATLMAGAGLSSAAHAGPIDDGCRSASPNASVCIGMDKVAEAGAAGCRQAAPPDGTCTLPVGRDVSTTRLAQYAGSWTHRAAAFQYALGDSVPLRDAQWLGTHNSFNTDSNGVTLSHTDNNQQLTLTQQLDGDIRAIELDVHYWAGAVRVCHGRGPDEMHAGCTTEDTFANVLPEVKRWLDAHPSQVILIYLEDELGDDAGYAETVSTLDSVLGSKIFKPAPGATTCREEPLDASRDDVRAAGAQVVLVGNCRAGWASDVFGWDASHVESGSTPSYKPFPACDATYNAGVYATKLVRYFEDSTWLSAAIDPAQTPADHDADSLTPEKVASMTRCGVNLFGLDQFDPTDGRVDASIWSLAPDQAPPVAGECFVQRADSRWAAADCTGARYAACRTATGWTVTSYRVAFSAADEACEEDAAGTFAAPRTGQDNSLLRQAAGSSEVWLAQVV